MLNQLPTIGENHLLQRQHLVDRHTRMLEKVKKENLNKDKYWIMGWAESKRKKGQTHITPKMMALYEMPTVKNESYVYEVDNIAGTQALLWVMHPNNKLSLPSLGKSIQVAAEAGE